MIVTIHGASLRTIIVSCALYEIEAGRCWRRRQAKCSSRAAPRRCLRLLSGEMLRMIARATVVEAWYPLLVRLCTFATPRTVTIASAIEPEGIERDVAHAPVAV